MIPAIGIMVGFYIITRMLDVFIGRKDGQMSPIVRIFAGLTIATAIYGIYVLLTTGIETSNIVW